MQYKKYSISKQELYYNRCIGLTQVSTVKGASKKT